MYVQPNGHIKLLTGVRLNNTYKNTIFFTSKEAQTSYFSGKAKRSFDNQSYTRAMNGVLKVQCTPDQIYDCNYLMFQNEGFGNKWFYAFINKVEYINNNCCEVRFELDVIQTWFFEFNITKSFVEREHSVTDGIGDNILDEPISTGTLLPTNKIKSNLIGKYGILIASQYDVNQDYTDPSSVKSPVTLVGNNMINGLDFNFFEVSGSLTPLDLAAAIQNFIDNATEKNKVDSIVSMVIFPRFFNTKQEQQDPGIEHVTLDLTERTKWELPRATSFKYSDGTEYVPRNKKLLTYPFCYMNVTSGNASNDYRYEWFHDSVPTFYAFCPFSLNPEVSLEPANYNEGKLASGDITLDSIRLNTNERLIMNGFPQMAFAIDTYRAWLAQSASAYNINREYMSASNFLSQESTAGSFISSAMKFDIGGMLNAANQATANRVNYNYATALMQNQKDVTLSKGSTTKGSQGSAVDIAQGIKDFYAYTICPTLQNAKSIDDYFDMYGYTCNRVKDPNISSRPHWNYVKTVGANIIGTAPTDDAAKIASIFDSGITFWKNGDNIGDYSLNNAPV